MPKRDSAWRNVFEDAFDNRDTSSAKLAWVNGWRKLPHIDPEVQRLYEYPQQFAEEIYARIEREFRRRDCDRSRTGRLYIPSGDGPETTPTIPELPARYFASSDKQLVAQLLRDRQEAHFLLSYETPSGWIALKKELLTDVLAAGRDAKIAGLPRDAAQVLRLMCTDLLGNSRKTECGAN